MATKTTGRAYVKLEGVNDALKTLKEYPNKINFVVKKSLKVAVTPTIQSMKTLANPKFRKIIKYKLLKGKSPAIKFGFFGTKGEVSEEKKKPPLWFKAYYKNYGTLDRRFKGHTFERSRKTKTKDWSGGIAPVLFFERSVVGKEQDIYSRFENALTSEVKKLEDGK